MSRVGTLYLPRPPGQMDSMLTNLSVKEQREPEYAMRGNQNCSSPIDPLRIQDNGQIARLNRHMLDWERRLDDRDDHATVPTRIKVTMSGVFWDEHGVSSTERR